jgi:hypothetical protein
MKKALLVAISTFFLVVGILPSAMAEKVEKSFSANGTQTLFMQDLFANVIVSVGSESGTTIIVSEEKKIVEDIIIKQDNLQRVSIRGKNGSRNSVSMCSFMWSIITSSNDPFTSVKLISGGEPVNINVIVPVGTSIQFLKVHNVSIMGLGSKHRVNNSAQGSITVSGRYNKF